MDAFRSYAGPKDRASMLEHLLEAGSRSVLKSAGDITGQAVHMDAHLGSALGPQLL